MFFRVLLLAILFFCGSVYAEGQVFSGKTVTIGTGATTGVYYPAGGAVCRLLNGGRREHGIRCSVVSTGGSVYNLQKLRTNELDVAAVQSDWQYHSVKGTAAFETLGSDKGLRSLFSLYSEPFTVIVRDDSGIKSLDDLKGKKVNIGDSGSGMRGTFDLLMQKKGWTKSDFKEAATLKPQEQIKALCDGKIDVMLYMAGHPNATVQEVTTRCKAKIIPVTGAEVEALIKENPFYTVTTIPGGKYPGNADDVQTFGVKATFVASEKTQDEIVYQLAKSVFENFDNFKTLHPVFATLQKERMVFEGNIAPLHKGAERYFKESGLLDKIKLGATPAEATEKPLENKAKIKDIKQNPK